MKEILRREILPSGKSRAFVNDTPVTLSVLNQLRSKLMDVHSQHQTMQLSDASFQFMVLDGLSKNAKKVASYKRGVQQLHQHKKELEELESNQRTINLQYDYNLHLLKELKDANLRVDEQKNLEEKLGKLNNIEDQFRELTNKFEEVNFKLD